MEHAPEGVGLGRLLQLGAGVGDGHEVRARLLAQRRLGDRPEMPVQDVGLQRRPRLGGDQEEGAGGIDQALEAADLGRIGGVQHQQLRKARLGPEGLGQHLGPQAGAAHAQQQHMREPGRPHLGLEGLQRHQVHAAGLAGVQPSQPLGLVGAGPQAGVAGPQPVDPPLLARPRQGLGHLGVEARRQPRQMPIHAALPRISARLEPTAPSSLSKASVKEATPSTTSLTVMACRPSPRRS